MVDRHPLLSSKCVFRCRDEVEARSECHYNDEGAEVCSQSTSNKALYQSAFLKMMGYSYESLSFTVYYDRGPSRDGIE